MKATEESSEQQVTVSSSSEATGASSQCTSCGIILLVACLCVYAGVCLYTCMLDECAFELGVCKYFLTGCLFACEFVCVSVYVCACVRRHSSTLTGTRRCSYTHTCVGRASRSHVRKVNGEALGHRTNQCLSALGPKK